MVAFSVAQMIVTFWADEYVPAAGENVGVATNSATVYNAVAISLFERPSFTANALIVLEASITIGSA